MDLHTELAANAFADVDGADGADDLGDLGEGMDAPQRTRSVPAYEQMFAALAALPPGKRLLVRNTAAATVSSAICRLRVRYEREAAGFGVELPRRTLRIVPAPEAQLEGEERVPLHVWFDDESANRRTKVSWEVV